MSPLARGRSAAAVLALGMLGGGLLAAGLGASTAFAAGNTDTAPVTVTVPGTPGATPSSSPTATVTASPNPTSGAGQGGGNGGGHGNGGGSNPHYTYGNGYTGDHGGNGPGGDNGGDHVPGTKPALPRHPAKGTLKVTITPNKVFRKGDRITVGASGFNAGEKVELVLYYANGKPVDRGPIAAGSTGAFSANFALPALDPGRDTVQLTGWDSSKVGTGTFLMGASPAIGPVHDHRTLWYGIGGCAGLAVAGVGAWFGIRAILSVPITMTKV